MVPMFTSQQSPDTRAGGGAEQAARRGGGPPGRWAGLLARHIVGCWLEGGGVQLSSPSSVQVSGGLVPVFQSPAACSALTAKCKPP